jgi:hypothetical protein
MNKLKNIASSFFLGTLLLLASGCKEPCLIPEENINKGDITPNSYVYGNNWRVKAVWRKNFNDAFTVSFDKGYSYGDIDFNQYVVMNYPVKVTCNTGFEREVIVSPIQKKVTYKLKIINCKGGCQEEFWVENWVLVKKFTKDYTISYILD